ncbi:LysR family transcriptional regulator [Paenibacillus sp. 598K]|uniref:LysR family transcriptional regulator n=1 Tax=Paenibacillus sp. 598K TaxID=1117987 RepID=UPI000FF9969D|nr:LysR family transcriptional regulator [Paenibacillus sp. 598K]GBF74794.1 LysR family transcriptional regulator [Paenibacillus sp. 598K]
MNLEHIESFVYVIHYGGFNKAADVLFLSQPTVTARIQSLERELGVKLFDRIGKQVTLTDKGREFLPYAQQMLGIYQKSRQQLQPVRSDARIVRIGCTVSVANYVIADILPEVYRRHPDVLFKLATHPSDLILEKLIARKLELGFVRNISHPAIHSRRFYRDPIRLYVYPGHPLIGREATVAEVARQPLVFFECGALDWVEVHRVFEKLEQPLQIRYEVDNSETAKRLILQQAAIGFLPSLSVKREVAEGRLIEIALPDIDNIALTTNLIAHTQESSPILESLIDICSGMKLP